MQVTLPFEYDWRLLPLFEKSIGIGEGGEGDSHTPSFPLERSQLEACQALSFSQTPRKFWHSRFRATLNKGGQINICVCFFGVCARQNTRGTSSHALKDEFLQLALLPPPQTPRPREGEPLTSSRLPERLSGGGGTCHPDPSALPRVLWQTSAQRS